MSYKSWPLGQLPQEFQRPELEQIKKLGYKWKEPRDVITIFEEIHLFISTTIKVNVIESRSRISSSYIC